MATLLCPIATVSQSSADLGIPRVSLVQRGLVLEVSGEVKFYDAPTDSGNMVSRGFCPTCGSAIYSTNSGMPDLAFPRALSLDDPEVFQPQLIVYAKRAASWDKMDTALPAFEGMPPPQDMPDM